MAVMPLLFEYDLVDYDINLTPLLKELLDKDTPIKLDSEYVNDYIGKEEATEDNIKKYSDCPVFTELKDDMYNFAEDICKTIRKYPEVKSAVVDSSKSVGLSTYIDIIFKHPKDFDKDVPRLLAKNKKFLNWYDSGKGGVSNGLAGEYKLNIRLSNHEPKITGADVYINMKDKLFNDVRDRVLFYVKDRIAYINKAWKDYKTKGIFPQGQETRNHARSAATKSRQPWISEQMMLLIKNNLSQTLKESFGKDRLQSIVEVEAENVLEYLKMSNVKLEDIVSAVESEFAKEPIIYANLLAACAECLVENVIEYTFDGGFDYELLFDDIRDKLNQ